MRFVPLALMALAITFASPSVKADDQIDCTAQEKTLSPGSHSGIFVDVRVKQDWPQEWIHFLFKNDTDNKYYCVRQTTNGKANIIALAEKAFLLNLKVIIDTAADYWMTGVLFKATE